MKEFTKGLGGIVLAAAFTVAATAQAACPALPHTISNGQVADADKVMANLEALRNCAGGGMTLLSSQNASSSANIDFTSLISPVFDNYILEVTDVTLSAVAHLNVIYSSDNGATWDESNIYDTAMWQTNQRSYSGNASMMNIGYGRLMNFLLNSASSAVSGRAEVYKPSNTNFKHISYHLSGVSHDGNFYNYTGSIRYKSNNPVNAIRIKPSSGVISSGTIRLYGVIK